jgi:predicted lipoprotein with Yx(FWY)xxD motif
MTMNVRRTLLLPSVVAIAAIAAACSSGGAAATTAPSVAAPTTAPSSAPASTEPSAPASEAASPAAAGVSLALADSKFGKIIVAGNRMTLYMFTPDEDGGKPTCYDQCAASWPALKADDAASVSVGAGLDASKLTVVDRTDGGKQVKYGEYPLYFFANDKAAGDVNGQGVATKWYVVGADGEPIKS